LLRGGTEKLDLDCLAVAKRRNQQGTYSGVAPSSAAYRAAHARRRQQLRQQRQSVAVVSFLVALIVGGVAYAAFALSQHGNQVRVIRAIPPTPPITTVTVTVPAERPTPSESTTTPRVAGTAAANASASAINSGVHVPRPPIVWKPIPFSVKRRAETAAYARHHYGIDSWRLEGPRVIVEHYTASSSFSSAFNTFAADVPDGELHELPAVCVHFVVDTDGTIYQLVPLDTICRHTVGLNWTAVGIEHVGTSDAQILGNPRQLQSSAELTLWLMQQLQIKLANVIGHNESLTSPYHRELVAAWRCQTHADWRYADMVVYRRKLKALARTDRFPIGMPAPPRPSNC
jgi:N-acetylmuramoyl-L-alanine amidase